VHPYWPLFDLEVRTPTLTLRYVNDDLAVELAGLIEAGIHGPGVTPFATAWSTVPSPQRERDSFRHYWRWRTEVSAEKWAIEFAAIEGTSVIGCGGLMASDFSLVRSVETGSWLGRAHQGRGCGKELRAGLLHLAFAGLGAAEATTAAWGDNAPSLGVTRHFGYEPNGVFRGRQGSGLGHLHRFRMSREHWETIRRDDIEIRHLDGCLDLLGLAT
jgi:RimJ/RimL family protein N-acetyltransferase